jgi:RNA-directed DNA polymerase
MSENRQNQGGLALRNEPKGEARKPAEGTAARMAKRAAESPAPTDRLMEEVVEEENLRRAWKRVKANQGRPGVEGMTVFALKDYWNQHWPAIRDQLLMGSYQPQPVLRVEIKKPEGGMRKLGIPTVVDRFIQQAVMQVLQNQWDGTFSDHSYGFRPGRSAHQAVARAQQYIAEGHTYVMDLEKFLDTASYCPLIHESSSNKSGI